MHYRPLAGVPGIELRTHETTLYNSLYMADGQLLVNAHVWGENAYGAPVWHALQVEQTERGPVLRCETTDQGVDL